jgi:hypothetical protein
MEEFIYDYNQIKDYLTVNVEEKQRAMENERK